MVTILERYIAAMVLSGVGDALGYKNGKWEFCHSGQVIQDELKDLGGLSKLHVKLPGWPVSDDTVMHLATADALASHSGQPDKEKLYLEIARKYKECMRDMAGRAPGPTCMNFAHQLRPDIAKGYEIEFNPRGGGCGAAMRAMCIGLRYPYEEHLDDLIAVSVESGRMTHHHPVGYLGSMAAALFTSYSIQGKPVRDWGVGLLGAVEKTKEYIKQRNHQVSENMKHWDYFKESWTKYLSLRKIDKGRGTAVFPEKYGVKERDEFYKSVSFSGWGGSSGHDAPMIAYDALLVASNDWEELTKRSMFHGGDSDSTGVIAAACYGAMHGLEGVPEGLHKDLEYRDRLVQRAKDLYKLSHPDSADKGRQPAEGLGHPDSADKGKKPAEGQSADAVTWPAQTHNTVAPTTTETPKTVQTGNVLSSHRHDDVLKSRL